MGNIENVVRLKQNDVFINGTEKQYKQIAKQFSINDKVFINNCLVRNGVFWSERYKTLIAGNLSSGNKMEFKEFITALKNTIND